MTDHVDGDQEDILARLKTLWNSRPRTPVNQGLRSCLDELEADFKLALSGKDRRTLTQEQKAAVRAVNEKLEQVMPLARNHNYVPEPLDIGP